MRVAVKNYGKAANVNVVYDNGRQLLHNSDTLLVEALNSDSLLTPVIRRNVNPNSYAFVAPTHSTVYLQPLRLGQPIRQIEIITADSVLRYDLIDRKQYKKLKKNGVIIEKGFLFKNQIIINKR